eukprot:jgi/Ulvmu1/10094/UM006_0041.1
MRLEFLLICAAPDSPVTESPALDDLDGDALPVPQKPRQDPGSHQQATHALTPAEPSRASPTAPQPQDRVSRLGVHGHTAPPIPPFDNAAAKAQPSAGAARSASPSEGALWSGCLRCAVNELHDARAALQRIVRDIVDRCCAVAPPRAIMQILEAYLVYLRRLVGRNAQRREQARRASKQAGAVAAVAAGGGGLVARSVAAAGTAFALNDIIASMADMNVLRQLATCNADKGLQGLVRVHEAHERVVGHMKEFQLLPGVLLGALQYVRIYSAHVLSGATPVDALQLFQLADEQQRWWRSGRRWLEGAGRCRSWGSGSGDCDPLQLPGGVWGLMAILKIMLEEDIDMDTVLLAHANPPVGSEALAVSTRSSCSGNW